MQERLENILLAVSRSADIDGGQLDKATETILEAIMDGLQITALASGYLKAVRMR